MKNISSPLTKLLLVLPLFLIPFPSHAAPTGQGIILYTPYTSRSVTPGKNLNYKVEVINRTNSIQDVSFSVRGLPSSWEPTFAAGTTPVQQIAIKPKTLGKENSQNITLKLEIPLKIKKGVYHFKLIGKTDSGKQFVLPLKVDVTKQGIFKTELQVDQANMEGYSDSNFNYNFTLKNQTASKQNYALTADSPRGWDIRFRVSGDYVTSVNLGSNESKSIYVKVTPPKNAKADKYKLKIKATSGSTSDQVPIEAVIKGKYDLSLTTPTGRLSTEVTAGSKKDVKLSLKNTGTVALHDVKLSSSAPADWNVEFDANQIPKLSPGATTTVVATIQASDKAIAGDYQLKINAKTPEAADNAAFRVTVNKSVAWGSVGILIIILVVGGIGYLFKQYGRR